MKRQERLYCTNCTPELTHLPPETALALFSVKDLIKLLAFRKGAQLRTKKQNIFFMYYLNFFAENSQKNSCYFAKLIV